MKRHLLTTLAIISSMGFSLPAFAADGASQSGFVSLAAALCIGLAVIGGAYGQGRMTAAALESIGRNPTNAGAMIRVSLFVALGMTESLVLFAMLIAYQLQSYAGALVKAG